MEKITLTVAPREVHGRKTRTDGRTPGVIYGHGFASQNVWIDPTELMHTFEKSGTNTVITVTVEGGESVQALIHDYQVDAISNQFTHVDFFHVRMDEKVETHIPIVAEGEAPAVKAMGGLLTMLDAITVRALPGDLIHEVTVDISGLATFDDRITVADLALSDAIEVITDAATTVASVSAPRTQEEPETAEGDSDAVEGEAEAAAEEKSA